ncbi:AraC family transcriptional regulator [Pseudomonas gingeri]|uniref:AraC family transcriptional regulator n=1 Tax=Pseudomonas gingeri TaxID=117681 RepID=UPI0015A05029|nr:AraC family transcriptional regulator [Pseudomonas gingeri]NWD04153.1 AraC family transcriptional regulator [Pseudomonas gingeri]NWE34215.1 AraC family transcriptional regulator [Pseudomonas gingeri]NWE56533.1 AraC family transcriptional regulator [Pseudomonas gingeri]NWF05749.1 AraC family transcriptional regulator [Pseudomonas gingeri]
MIDSLLNQVHRYAQLHADPSGIAKTPIPGLTVTYATLPGGLVHEVSHPLICLILQGSKRVSVGKQSFKFKAGDSVLITADTPTVSQITQASNALPYLSLVVDLDPVVIADLSVEMSAADIRAMPLTNMAPVLIDHTDTEVADAALRLMRLIERPASMRLLHVQLIRELHYWLLAGRHGGAIRRLGWREGRSQRVARAVALLRAEFIRPLLVNDLAAAVGMSPSSFYNHFRAATSLSPLQFQKQLRLIEARRLMMSVGVSASSAAFAVGYESVSQFTREYGRMFGLPPAKDMDSMGQTTQSEE